MDGWRGQVTAIRLDRRSGAAVLAARGVRALGAAVREAGRGQGDPRSLLGEAARALAATRPGMAAVVNTAAVFAAGLPHGVPRSMLLREARGSVEALARYWRDAPEALARLHAPRFAGAAVVTHSLSSDVLRTLVAAGPRHVFVGESRTGQEGRVTAARLAAAGIAVTVVPDGALGHCLREADLAVSGADSVLADGGVVNKTGTYQLALAAMDRSKPYYALAETMKVSPEREPRLQEEDPAAVWRNAPAGVALRNPLFEAVPGALVSAVLTEDGELDAETLGALAGVFAEQRAALTPPEHVR